MMAAILNSAILDSDICIFDLDTLLSSLRFTQKHSHSSLTLTQTNSISLIWWWQPSWILSSWIQPFCTKLWFKLIQSDSNSFILTQLDDGSHLELYHLGFSQFAEKKLHSIILTQIDESSYLEFCHAGFSHSHLGFRHLVILPQIHSKHSHSTQTLTQTNAIWLKLIHCPLAWWWQPSWILPSWIQPFCTKLWIKLIQSDWNSFILPQPDDVSHLEICHLGFNHFEENNLLSFILTQLDDGSHLEFYHLGFSHFGQKKLHSFILTQLDDGRHLEFCHVGFRHCHLGFRHLVIFSESHSKTLSLHSGSDSNKFNLT